MRAFPLKKSGAGGKVNISEADGPVRLTQSSALFIQNVNPDGSEEEEIDPIMPHLIATDIDSEYPPLRAVDDLDLNYLTRLENGELEKTIGRERNY